MVSQPPWYRDKELPYDYFVAILHPTDASVLMFPEGDAWTLPSYAPEVTDQREVTHITHAMKHQRGIDTFVMRCLRHHYDPDARYQYRIYAAHSLSRETQIPDGARWIPLDELEDIGLSYPQYRYVLTTWLAEVQSADVPDLRAPWAIPGWFAQASEWIDDQLGDLGITRTGPMEQLRAWCISCLLKIQTTHGDVYFKAVPKFMAIEPVAIQALSERYPSQVPPPLATCPERGWTLMSDFDSEWLGNVADLGVWKGAVRGISEIHVQQAKHANDWLALGVPDRSLGRVVELVDSFIGFTLSVFSRQPFGLNEDESSRLQGLSMRLKLMCAQLADYNIPHTLIHGDIGGNVLAKDGNYIYFDWTDACVSHPFIDMTTMISTVFDELHAFEDIPDVQEQLREAYLEPWLEFEPMDRLVQAFEVAQTLGTLHQCMSYIWIITNLAEDTRWELENALPIWVRGLLKSCLSLKQFRPKYRNRLPTKHNPIALYLDAHHTATL